MKSKIPTKQEFMAIKSKADSKSSSRDKAMANRHISKASDRIREGKFSYRSGWMKPSVSNLVSAAFKKAGYAVDIEEYEITCSGRASTGTGYKFTFSMESKPAVDRKPQRQTKKRR